MELKEHQIQLKFAELHSPLFLAGKNFGAKLDPTKLAGLELAYDRVEKELLVHWTEEIGIIPSSNVACMTQGTPVMKSNNEHPIVIGMRSAQVDSPQSHVHAGLGHGKTGKSK